MSSWDEKGHVFQCFGVACFYLLILILSSQFRYNVTNKLNKSFSTANRNKRSAKRYLDFTGRLLFGCGL
jgi:hypothetical protein